MRITDLRVIVVGNPWKNWVLVALDTDAGITGYGEATLGVSTLPVTGALDELRPLVVGEDPAAIDALVGANAAGLVPAHRPGSPRCDERGRDRLLGPGRPIAGHADPRAARRRGAGAHPRLRERLVSGRADAGRLRAACRGHRGPWPPRPEVRPVRRCPGHAGDGRTADRHRASSPPSARPSAPRCAS